MNSGSLIAAVRRTWWLAVLCVLPVGACGSGSGGGGGGDGDDHEPIGELAEALCANIGEPCAGVCRICASSGACVPDLGDTCITGSANGLCDNTSTGHCCTAGCIDTANNCQTALSAQQCGVGDYCHACTAGACQVAACTSGECSSSAATDRTACTGGLCFGGNCCQGCWTGTGCSLGTDTTACGSAGAACVNCAHNNECVTDSCVSGSCATQNVAAGTSCMSGAGKCELGACCTGCWDGTTCQPGKTVTTACGTGGAACVSCDDGNDCTTDSCTNGGCVHTPIADMSSCGKCGGTPPPSCDDKNPCTTDSCNPPTGCAHANADGTSCNDNNPCTQNDQCSGGVCTPGTPLACPASDDCHQAGTCDTTSGTCTNPPVKDGAACTGGSCKSAKCVPNGSGGSSGGVAAGGATNSGGTGGSDIDSGVASAGRGGDGSSGSSALGASGSTNLYARDPGGCACRVGSNGEHGTRSLVGVAMALLLSLRRRRRRAPSLPPLGPGPAGSR